MRTLKLKSLIREHINSDVNESSLNGKTIKVAKFTNEYELELQLSDGNSVFINGMAGYEGELAIMTKSMFSPSRG